MKKTLFDLGVALSVVLAAGSSDRTAPVQTRLDWSEPLFSEETPDSLWRDVAGTQAAFGSIDERYARPRPYEGAVVGHAALTGWRGERVSAQAVVWSSEGAENLRCTVGDFVATDGTRLERAGRARFVNYVLADDFDPSRPCGERPADNPVRLAADLLDEAETSHVAARTLRPVWITVDIPREARAASCRPEVSLRADGGFEQRLQLDLEVIDRVLPPAAEWDYHLDLWQHPSAVADIEGLEMWSDDHFRAMEPTMRMLAAAGQKVITATLNKDPWNCQTEYPYADMIVWTRLADGSWEYDFTVFDRWVEYMTALGVDKAINCYSLLPWNNELHYVDDVTGETVDVVAAPTTPQFREMWAPFLTAFSQHLREKGWLERTNIAMDERSDADMAAAVGLLGEAAPELGIALADNSFIFRKYPHIKDMCVSIFADMDLREIDLRRAEGKTTTYYVCCSSGFPNTYTTSDPLEAVFLSWFALARGYDGFLRWSYNAWTADPVRDTRFRTWAAGDTYMVYPEGRSSIRFERLVEGIQDWEKVQLLRREWRSSRSSEDAERLRRLDEAVARFGTLLPYDGWRRDLNDAKRLVNELSR